jgi:GT2 family glycosyltransferase
MCSRGAHDNYIDRLIAPLIMNVGATSYSVVLVNFGTEYHVRNAIGSIEKCALSSNYSVVVVNNGSQSPEALRLLEELRSPRVHVLTAPSNLGFSKGNNLGIHFAVEHLSPQFIVVMNPDVTLERSGTIERLMARVMSSDERVVGAQPLIDNYRSHRSPHCSVQIRQVPTIFDLIVAASIVLRYVFPRRFRSFLMVDRMPYNEPSYFLVPSGAFFIVRTKAFLEIGCFDEGTFLYAEELIIGEKLRRRGEWMILDPSELVQHFQAASTGLSKDLRPNMRMYAHRAKSELYFARAYLNAGWLQCLVLAGSFLLGFLLRLSVWPIRKVFGPSAHHRIPNA